MPHVGFEPTIPVFERARKFHALERAATVIGYSAYRAVSKYVNYVINSYFHSSVPSNDECLRMLTEARDVLCFTLSYSILLKETTCFTVKI
jgi:hypothetical protein